MSYARSVLGAAVATLLLAQPAAAQRHDPEGEAVKGAIFGMFGQLMEHAQQEMQKQQRNGATPMHRAQPFVVPPGYSTQLPPPPSLPPIYRPGREGDYRRY